MALMRPSTLLLTLLSFWAALFIGGCGGSGVSDDPQGPLLAFHGDQPAAQQVVGQVEGEVLLDDRGCLRLRTDRFAEDSERGEPMLIMPEGYAYRTGGTREPLSVVGPRGEVTFRVGEAVVLRAGDVDSLGDIGIGSSVARRLEDQCPGSYLYVDAVLDQSAS